MERSFADFGRARDALPEINPAARAGTIVFLGGGIHRLEAPLRFDERDATMGGEFVYQARPAETPMASGG